MSYEDASDFKILIRKLKLKLFFPFPGQIERPAQVSKGEGVVRSEQRRRVRIPARALLPGRVSLERHCWGQLRSERCAEHVRLALQLAAGPEVLPGRSALQLLPPVAGGRRLHARVHPSQRPVLLGRPLFRTGGATRDQGHPAARSQEGPGHRGS